MIEVVAAVLEKDGKFLIACRKKGAHLEGKWEFPGGKIEKGETPEIALKRELQEEFGIDCEIGNFVAESIFDYGKGKEIRLAGFLTVHLAGEFLLNDHSEIRWISKSEFDNFDFAPADMPIVDALR